jgi:hypothetical protein
MWFQSHFPSDSLQMLITVQWFWRENLSWLHSWSNYLWPYSWRMWCVCILIHCHALLAAHFHDGSSLGDFEVLPNKRQNSVVYWLCGRSFTSYIQSNHNIHHWKNTKYEFQEAFLNKLFFIKIMITDRETTVERSTLKQNSTCNQFMIPGSTIMI